MSAVEPLAVTPPASAWGGAATGPAGPVGPAGPTGPAGAVLLKSTSAEQYYTNSTAENTIGQVLYADCPQLKNGDRMRISYFATAVMNGSGVSYTYRLQYSGGITCLAYTHSPSQNASRFTIAMQYELLWVAIGTQVIAKGQIQINTAGTTQWTPTGSLTSVSAAQNNMGMANFAGAWAAGSEFHWTVAMSTANSATDIRPYGSMVEYLPAAA